MECEQQFSTLIYEYFLKRLHFGYYTYGDTLPTVDVLCREFNVSDHTIWTALRRLRAEGYISMKNGQVTKVIYKQTEEERRKSMREYFAERWEAYNDLYETTELLYVPLMIEGLCRMDEQDKDYIAQLAERAGSDDIILFYCSILQKIENPLLMNLFWETSLYLGVHLVRPSPELFQYDVTVGRSQFQTLVSLIKEKSWNDVRNTLIQYQRSYMDNIRKSLEHDLRVVPKKEQIPFTWRIYRDRPQICYNLASLLLHEIYMGEYRTTEFLPSYEKMAEKYEISVSTIRRTVSMLNQVGAVQSINGKGTRVFTIGERCCSPDFTSSVVRRNLSYFIQSFELLFYTCKEVSRCFIQSLAPEERQVMIARLEENQRTGLCEISIWHYLLFITKYSRSQAIREIYGTTYSLFLWGYPLKASLEAAPDTERNGELFTASMLKGLLEDDTEQCVSAVKTYIKKQLPKGKGFLIHSGIKAEELRLSPSIRMLLVGD
ncbi:GntR family transcriptional regulator [Blautia schinkii]|nr:GntR family transcriptional regulator [Blautia schinkii]